MGIFPTDDPRYAATYAEEAAMVDAAELIASALDERGITRADLARALGVSRSEITARLRGERNMTVRSLAATLHALGKQIELSVRPEPDEPTRLADAWRPRPEDEPGFDHPVYVDGWVQRA
jgi:transcriptional regulator with XRE-family HTH domain